MTNIAIKRVGATCAIAASFSGAAALWARNKAAQKASHLEREQRGNPWNRLQEIVHAFFKKKEIEDLVTSVQHVDFVATLSKAPENDHKTREELKKVRTSYSAGYLFGTVDRMKSGIPIFRHMKKIPVFLPEVPGMDSQGFVFSGTSSNLFDPQARKEILDGRYTRCLRMLPRQNLKQYWNYSESEVIITGTTDCKKCEVFANQFFHDFVMIAAGMGEKKTIDLNHPFADTLVFELKDRNIIQKVGDLAQFPEETKRIICTSRFTICDFLGVARTRLSRGEYKDLKGVVAGIENPKICDVIFHKDIPKFVEIERRKKMSK